MILVLDNDALPYKDDAPMAIITTNEDGKTRASVVLYYTEEDGHKMVGPHLKGSLADSDSEALLSLYEDSKVWLGKTKEELKEKGLWR